MYHLSEPNKVMLLGVIINGKEFLKFEGDQNKFIQQYIELYMHYLKKDSHASKNSFNPGRPTV